MEPRRCRRHPQRNPEKCLRTPHPPDESALCFEKNPFRTNCSSLFLRKFRILPWFQSVVTYKLHTNTKMTWAQNKSVFAVACGCGWGQSGSTLDWPKSVWPNSVLLGQTLETPTLATVGWAKVGHDCDRIPKDTAKSVGVAMRNRDTIEKYTSRTVTVSTKKSVVTRRVQQLGKCATTESCGTENARAIVGKMASAKGQSWKEGFGHITDIMKQRGQTHLKSVQSW